MTKLKKYKSLIYNCYITCTWSMVDSSLVHLLTNLINDLMMTRLLTDQSLTDGLLRSFNHLL